MTLDEQNKSEQTDEPSEQAKPESSRKSVDEIYNNLISKIESYMPNTDLAIVEKAFNFANSRHGSQLRHSGEPFITHPLEVATILTQLKLDLSSIVVAVLHDVVEDTAATLDEVEKEFGKDVRTLVDGLTKISKIKFRSNQEKLAENFRKMVLAMASDLRVILIKLADRLHNMRTLEALPIKKRYRIAEETLDIYAPLANRLGIYNIKSELEDLCLKQLKINAYRDISGQVSDKKASREKYIEEVRTIIENELKKYGFTDITVYGRPKHFYSIYKKIVDRNLDFDDIHDLFAFRIIVDSIKDCYEALGIIHAMWKPMPGRFKDYIAMPKANMYQSLHTTVIRPNGAPAEIQIRTQKMHDTCEYGIAAHWMYKEDGSESVSKNDLEKFSWLRQIMEWQTELKDPSEFLEAIKVDLFDEEIFVFTPKGDVLQLPIGATALDFAFAVHTDVGLTTVGAKVNGRMVPIKKPLKSGDIVEVRTSNTQKPSKDWLNFVATSKARNKIRNRLRADQRDRSRKLGRDYLEQELDKNDLDIEKLIKSGDISKLIKAAKESHLEDVLVAIGYGRLNPKELIPKAYGDRKPKKTLSDHEGKTESVETESSKSARKKQHHGILVSGIENVLVNFARCCNPLPGDDVIGFITRSRGVTVHRSNCTRALDTDPHRRVEVNWADESESNQRAHIAFLRVVASDKPGVLAEITGAISGGGTNIRKAQIRIGQDLMGILDFELALNSLDQLRAVIRKIEGIPSVVSVDRKSSQRFSKD